MARIEHAESWLIEIPTRRPHKLSFGEVNSLHHVVLRLRSSDGLDGWGEATVLAGPTWSEESAESIFATLDRYLIPLVLGADPDTLEALRIRWDARVRGNPFAKSALEMAILDLRARSLGIPLARLLGGALRERVPLSWSLASPSPDQDAREATEMVTRGHNIFKIKVGDRPVADDMRKVRMLREVLGPGISLRVDANQGWNRRQAFAALAPLADLGLDFLEQPLPRGDEEGMALLQRQSPIPLMADESVTTLREAARIAAIDAARAFSLKIAKHGGIVPALQVAALARAMGIGLYVGCMIETGIGTAAYAQLCAALPELEYGCELFGPLLLADDVLAEPIEYEPGFIVVPSGPGLGIDVDVEKLSAYARPGGHRLQPARARGETDDR